MKRQITGKEYEKQKRKYKKTYQYVLFFNYPVGTTTIRNQMKKLEIYEHLTDIQDLQDKKDIFNPIIKIKH